MQICQISNCTLWFSCDSAIHILIGCNFDTYLSHHSDEETSTFAQSAYRHHSSDRVLGIPSSRLHWLTITYGMHLKTIWTKRKYAKPFDKEDAQNKKPAPKMNSEIQKAKIRRARATNYRLRSACADKHASNSAEFHPSLGWLYGAGLASAHRYVCVERCGPNASRLR